MRFERVYTYGAAVLRQKAKPIQKADDRIRQLAKDMLVRMYESGGIGLAAEQVGFAESICVIDISRQQSQDPAAPPAPLSDPPVQMPIVLVNPRIEEMMGKHRDREGCLSFPEIYVEIPRAAEVVVSYMDLDGGERTLRAKGFLARAIQHEVDHLAGILLVDHMSTVQKVALAGRLKRLKREAAESDAADMPPFTPAASGPG